MARRSFVPFVVLSVLAAAAVTAASMHQSVGPACRGYSQHSETQRRALWLAAALNPHDTFGDKLSADTTSAGLSAAKPPGTPPTTSSEVPRTILPPERVVERPVAPPDDPGAPIAVCVSADMADVITFEPPSEEAPPRTYVLSSSASADGPFSVVATGTADTRSFIVPVIEAGRRYYTVSAQGASGKTVCSSVVDNDHVSLSSQITCGSATLRSSNGEIVLALAADSFAETATVTIEELEGTPVGGIISLAGVYDVSASVPLAAPARLSVAYTLAVTHHQVSATLLRAAGLMTYDEASSEWVAGAEDVIAEGGYLTGTLSHFSYWTGATIQPHGTRGTAVNYCTGVCHDLTTYPGSSVRYASRDSQVCYNCHGSADLSGPPAGAPGENVEAALCGNTILSRHPVGTGDLYCTACHDPHASPSDSPGMLRAWEPLTGTYVQGGGGVAPGNRLCWSCHGAVQNRRVNAAVPGYYARSDGDKQTAFGSTAHGGASTATVLLNAWGDSSETEFNAGTYNNVELAYSSAVGGYGIRNRRYTSDYVLTGNVQVDSAAPMSGGWLDDMIDNNNYSRCTFGPLTPVSNTISAEFTADLGAQRSISLVRLSIGYADPKPETFEVAVSTDGVNYTTIGTQAPVSGTLQISPNNSQWENTSRVTARFVRVKVMRYSTTTSTIQPGELRVLVDTCDATGTWTSQPVSLGGAAPAARLSCEPRGLSVDTAVTQEVQVAADGSTWGDWMPLGEDGAVDIAERTASAQARVRLTLSRAQDARYSPTAGPIVRQLVLRVSDVQSPEIGITWPGLGVAKGECGSCHEPHGTAGDALGPQRGTGVCGRCHQAAGGAFQGQASFDASAHAARGCDACHDPHGRANADGVAYPDMLVGAQSDTCFGCHNDPANSKSGVNVEERFSSPGVDDPASPTNHPTWSLRHNVDAQEQDMLLSDLDCSDCHGVHTSTGEMALVDPLDPSKPFSVMVPVPRLIRVPAVADATVDAAGGAPAGTGTMMRISPNENVLIRFDLSQIPAGAQIVDATVVLWRPPLGGQILRNDQKQIVGLHRLTEQWDEATVTWTERGAGLGAWSDAGGTASGTTYSRGYWNAHRLDATALLRELIAGPDYGVLIKYDGIDSWLSGNPLPRESREVAGSGPYLEVYYYPAEGPDMGYDSIAYCTKCHAGGMPGGIRQGMIGYPGAVRSLRALGASWSYSFHGAGTTIPPMPSSTPRTGAQLQAPYEYGYSSEMQCTVCHDPHGSNNVFHLRGDPVLDSYQEGVDFVLDTGGGSDMGYWCAQCHVGANHVWGNSDCVTCHYHGNRF